MSYNKGTLSLEKLAAGEMRDDLSYWLVTWERDFLLRAVNSNTEVVVLDGDEEVVMTAKPNATIIVK